MSDPSPDEMRARYVKVSMDDPDWVELTFDAYQAIYGSERMPTTIMLQGEERIEAAQLLHDAIIDDEPFEGDADFYPALGKEPPDPNAGYDT
jgi:hypothetical protein